MANKFGQFNSIRAINDACWSAAVGSGRYIFTQVEGEKMRIVRARTTRGVLQVRTLGGSWRTMQEGSEVYRE